MLQPLKNQSTLNRTYKWRFHVGFSRAQKTPKIELDFSKSHLERLEIWQKTIFLLGQWNIIFDIPSDCKQK